MRSPKDYTAEERRIIGNIADAPESTIEANLMSEHTTEETLRYLRQCLLPGKVQDGIDLDIPSWLVREAVTALAQLSKMEDALEHCGYDPTDCIDCGGPPHNEWCRFWKLRDVVPLLFDTEEGEDDDYGPLWDPAPNSGEEA